MSELKTIREVQGEGLFSALAGRQVEVQGVITGVLRSGFYIQTPNVTWDGKRSDAIFVYGRSANIKLGYLVRVAGECLNFLKHDNSRPITQIKLRDLYVLQEQGSTVLPLTLTQELLPKDSGSLAVMLNSLEGMLVVIPAQSTFIAPSNVFGDYVCALPHHFNESDVIKTKSGGLITVASNNERWFPGFRVQDYQKAPKLNVGAKLLSDVVGPLHYRVGSWQIASQQSFEFEDNPVVLQKSHIESSGGALTVLTLNGFNLDWHVESSERVVNPKMDVDDDWGDGRFHTLAQAIVLQANTPDVVALQEMQDNDGAELTNVVDASKTYTALIVLIKQLSGVEYRWADIPPQAGEDGGQPGGNIRNGYLYNPARVSLDQNTVALIDAHEPCFKNSRKPIVAIFKELDSGKALAVINVHLVSKREQVSVFAPNKPGVDMREDLRIEQADVIYRYTQKLLEQGVNYYITGDFNDHENSRTLQAFVGVANANLVLSLPPETRYDYNHRGKLQVLMHGVLPKPLVAEGKAEYDIIHGNELIGVAPGVDADKPSDHAYVLAKVKLS